MCQCLARDVYWPKLALLALRGMSPGDIAEMAITAKVLQLGAPVVTAFHVTRLAAVLLLAEPLYRWLYRDRYRDSDRDNIGTTAPPVPSGAGSVSEFQIACDQ